MTQTQKVTVNTDAFTLGDMELLESGKVADILKVFDRHITIEGISVEDTPAAIRAWTIADLNAISATIAEQVGAQTNPVKRGKN